MCHCDEFNKTRVQHSTLGLYFIEYLSSLVCVKSMFLPCKAVRTQPKCANESTHLTRVGAGRLHSTRRSRRVYADIYAISVAYHSTEMDLFYIPRRSLRIRILVGCGLLTNDNPASTRKRRRIVGLGVFTLGT